MTHSKKINYIDVMIFRFSFHRKKSELLKKDLNICEQEMLKSNFFSKKKNTLLNTYQSWLVILFLLHNILIHKV